jgi:sugar phosphate isomerase/epimerase
MKLGVAGMLPHWRQIDRAAAERVRDAGFRGASVFIDRPLDAEADAVLAVKRAFDEAGLEVAQANGWYECLVNPDDTLRADGVRGLQALCRWARLLDADTVYVRPGGLNPKGHWLAHPGNHTPETFERLIDSLGQVCAAAQDEGVTLAIEGHVLSPLDSAQRVVELLDAVASPALKFNVDPVNFIGTVRDVHDTRRVLNELYDLLGAETVAAHAKDCRLGDALVVHIEEVVPGDGTLDLGLFLRRFAACCPSGYVLIEHLPDEKVPAARKAVCRAAEQAGLTWEA